MPTIVVGDQEIPDVKGLIFAAATAALNAAGFFTIEEAASTVSSEIYDADTIAEQDPVATTVADPATTTVTLTVSSGLPTGVATEFGYRRLRRYLGDRAA